MKKKYQATIAVAVAVAAVALVVVPPRLIQHPDETVRKWQSQTTKLVISYSKESVSANIGEGSEVVITDEKEINAWLDLISVKPRYVWQNETCKCTGNPVLMLYADQQLLATISIHMGASIRCEKLGEGNFGLEHAIRKQLSEKCAALGLEAYGAKPEWKNPADAK